MTIRATLLAGLLGLPFLACAAPTAETAKLSLADAVKRGDHEAVRLLLNGHGKDEVAGREGAAALLQAAERNDKAMADLLLSAGVSAKAANDFGATALYAAAAHADPTMATKLLAAGADPNASLLSGETPLMEAARRGNLGTVRALLAAKADPNAKERNGGQTALMWAISERQSAVADELVQRGADINARSQRGFTPLMFAAQQDDAKSARILLNAGAKVNDVMQRTGVTPLIIASAMRRTDIVSMLLEKNADPNAMDSSGYSPLHYAARDRTALDILKVLLAHEANPNIRLHQDKPTAQTVNGVALQGATPLALAANLNNIENVRALVEAGADPLIPTEKGITPLMLAAGGGTDVVRPRPARERTTAIQTVRFLAEQGTDINGVGQYGWTPLHAAAYQGLNDVIEFLVAKGAKIDAKDEFGQTPLSIANAILTRDIGAAAPQIPRIFRRETVDLLLKLGATPLAQSGVVVVLQRTGD